MFGFAKLTSHWTLSTGPVIPDDRNMLNENQPSPDRPTIQGKHTPGIKSRTAFLDPDQRLREAEPW